MQIEEIQKKVEIQDSPVASHESHFHTGHLLGNLKGRAVSSSFVAILAQCVQFVLMLLSIVILARLLSPQEFGLIAMVTAIMSFLRVFNDAGLSTATVQREGITHAQVSNLFWANVALGGMISLLMAALSPVIAWFYREPRLVGITLAISITFLLSSSSVQHLALLKRQMRFKIIAVIQVSSAAATALVGIVMAWRHCGYWSLVGVQLAFPLVTFILAWSFSRWRPQLPKRHVGTRSLLHFGAHLTASNFLASLARGSDGLLIGKVFGSEALGLYSRAGALLLRPLDQLLFVTDAVFVPTLARLQSQPERYRRTMLKVYEVITISTFLFTGLVIALAQPLTLVVLGRKWENAAPILASFALAAVYLPLGSVSSWLLTSQGRGRDSLRLSVISSSVMVIAFITGLRFGPLGVALAFSISCLLIVMPIQYYITGRSGPVTTRDLWGRFLTHLPLWVVVCGTTYLVRELVFGVSPWKQLAVCAPAGLLAGTAFICIYPPTRRAALSLFDVLQEFRGKKSEDRSKKTERHP